MTTTPRPREIDVAIIGAGPAGLMAAETCARGGLVVDVFDAMAQPARKFLLAGRGGLNLTHSEDLEPFLDRYGPARAWLEPIIRAFPPSALRAHAATLGEETFIGSSGRVFPKSFKASPYLRAWLRQLDGLGIRLHAKHKWIGGDVVQGLAFERPEGPLHIQARSVILALGGASWPKLGSTGAWSDWMQAHGVPVEPLRPSNCGVKVPWSAFLAERFGGQPLKRIGLTLGDTQLLSEVMITATGLEGTGIYALSRAIRAALDQGDAVLHIDLLPDRSLPDVLTHLSARPSKQSLSTWLKRRLGLSPQAIAFAHEGAAVPLSAMSPDALGQHLKNLPIRIQGVQDFARAISTAGGIAASGFDQHLMLTALPGMFVAGEMLDMDAPTGGYLLQAAFATGRAAGLGALNWLGR
jgi:uncharacterized flavoprotein (TIGR03862 family)